MANIDDIYALADQNGYGEEFRSLVQMAERNGLVVRPHEKSIRFAPPQDKRRYLLTIWADPPGKSGGIQYDIYPAGFATFFPVTEEQAKQVLGNTDLYEVEEISPNDVPNLITAINTLFVNIGKHTSHHTYLLTWNPGKSDWENFQEDWENVYGGNRPRFEWSCGNTQRIEVGDRVFMMRLGWRESVTGIMASGWITGEPEEGQHWAADDARTALYVEFEPDVLLNPDADELLDPKIVSQDFNWHPQRSGITIPDEVAINLEKIWQRHIQRANFVEAPVQLDETGSKTFSEGTRKLISGYRYERDPHAREECLNAFGAICRVCDFDFSREFGEIGNGFIHVHHITPISQRMGEYILDAKNELVPVCPNCHAMLHRKSPPYSIDELKEIRAQATKQA